jgi:hypothetical protein
MSHPCVYHSRRACAGFFLGLFAACSASGANSSGSDLSFGANAQVDFAVQTGADLGSPLPPSQGGPDLAALASADLAAGDLAAPTAPLWPFNIGNSWSYSATGFCTGTIDRIVASANPTDGRAAFQIASSSTGCTTVDVSYSTPGGDEVDVDILGAWSTIIDPLLVEGHSWTYYGSTVLTWHEQAFVTVAAGTFNDCWTANSSDPSIATNTYCRGVGLVQSTSSSLNQELTAKNF